MAQPLDTFKCQPGMLWYAGCGRLLCLWREESLVDFFIYIYFFVICGIIVCENGHVSGTVGLLVVIA